MEMYVRRVEAIQITENFKNEPVVFNKCTIRHHNTLRTFEVDYQDGIKFADIGDWVVIDGGKVIVMNQKDFEEVYIKYEH